MAKINNDQVASDIKTAFEAMKTLFNVGSSSINLSNAEGGLASSGISGSKNDNAPFCISVCGMSDLVDAIKTMKTSLRALQSSLITLEYCLIILTTILSFAVAASALGIIFYLVKISNVEKSHQKSEVVENLATSTLPATKKKKIIADTELRETGS